MVCTPLGRGGRTAGPTQRHAAAPRQRRPQASGREDAAANTGSGGFRTSELGSGRQPLTVWLRGAWSCRGRRCPTPGSLRRLSKARVSERGVGPQKASVKFILPFTRPASMGCLLQAVRGPACL